MNWLRRPGGGTNRRPLLKKEIEDAQTKTLSAAGAARYLGVHYQTYKKYAKMYGIHDNHKNPSGKGVPKAKGSRGAVPLQDILDGKHPTYDVKRLKKRLIREGLLDEECSICGFKERRVTDYKVPLMLVFRDGNSANHKLENMTLLCFNCAFLTVGELNNINTTKVRKLAEIESDAVRISDTTTLSPEELEQAIAEARAELPDARTE